jgi:hypothetical protein
MLTSLALRREAWGRLHGGVRFVPRFRIGDQRPGGSIDCELVALAALDRPHELGQDRVVTSQGFRDPRIDGRRLIVW